MRVTGESAPAPGQPPIRQPPSIPEGFHDAHTAAGVDADPALVTEIELNMDGGYAGTRKLMEGRKRPSLDHHRRPAAFPGQPEGAARN